MSLRPFLLETKNGREIGIAMGAYHQDALKRARSMFKEPPNGWGAVRVFAQLLPHAAQSASKAHDVVRARLALEPSIGCPEGCAREARAAREAGDYALAAAWWCSASGCSIGHSRSAMYDREELADLRKLDPGYEPFNNII